MHPPNQPKFPLGRIVATQNAVDSIPLDEIQEAIERHQRGDWGTLDDADLLANEIALIEGTRLLSAYSSSADVRFWIVTEAERSVTTILLPADY